MDSTSDLSSPLISLSNPLSCPFQQLRQGTVFPGLPGGPKATLQAQKTDFGEIHEPLTSLQDIELTRDLTNLDLERKCKLDPKDHAVQPKPIHLVETSRFFAVIVGIDRYPSCPLRGCVSDARLMEKYLTEHLRVPKNRIQLLLGYTEDVALDDTMKPSRANIINALLSLATNDEIKKGDNIIIYFAGYGSYYPPSEDDDTYGFIETLCPIDRDIMDDNGRPIPDISDREFNVILSRIAEAKGQRITVILDCCHAGGASRTMREPGSRSAPKGASALHEMLLAGESYLKDHPGYRSILEEEWNPDMESHVLLAACKDYQFAKEKAKREDGRVVGYIGVFTEALVHVLQSGNCVEKTTYVDIIRAAGALRYQTPVVFGTRKNARIWFQG
ncbi:caspase domain-containing protein [Armillaria novae-zelandiae]|uniref:Caspase domain-containing protein n=1 Tax=Armillaria novae-zelandiae TaxID=153914 RepID=A0AA39U6K6_9AGAR|nr:caspase domain-containing protein [Armillaria novae-zelandiae]